MQKPAVNVMVKAARAGGNILLRHMQRLDALNVVEKDRLDYASEVDGLAEAEIIKELKRASRLRHPRRGRRRQKGKRRAATPG